MKSPSYSYDYSTYRKRFRYVFFNYYFACELELGIACFMRLIEVSVHILFADVFRDEPAAGGPAYLGSIGEFILIKSMSA